MQGLGLELIPTFMMLRVRGDDAGHYMTPALDDLHKYNLKGRVQQATVDVHPVGARQSVYAQVARLYLSVPYASPSPRPSIADLNLGVRSG